MPQSTLSLNIQGLADLYLCFGKATVVATTKFSIIMVYHWKWIQYDATVDVAFCLLCNKAAKQENITCNIRF